MFISKLLTIVLTNSVVFNNLYFTIGPKIKLPHLYKNLEASVKFY